MTISAVCPSCSAKIKAPDSAKGKRVECPSCKIPFIISVALPKTADPIKKTPVKLVRPIPLPGPTPQVISCPHCLSRVAINQQNVGMNVACPECGQHFQTQSRNSSLPSFSSPGAGSSPSWLYGERLPQTPVSLSPPPELPPLVEPYSETRSTPRSDNRGISIVNVNENTVHHQHQVGGSNSLGIASLVLGLFALVFSLIPCLGIVGLPLSALGLLLGLIGCIVAITRNGHGIGFSIAGSVVCGLSLLAGLFWLSMIGASATAINQVAKTNGATNQKMDSGNNKGNEPGKENEKKGDEPGKENEWIDATNFGARLDSIIVRVTSVHVDFVPLRKLGRETKSEEKLLQIHLSIENESDTKKIEYDSWGFSRDILNRHVPSLKDNFGNAHHRAHWEFAIEVEGQLRSASILPGKSIKDVLVFDLPVDKAQYLRLELPASAFGGTGMLRLQIPKKMIVGDTSGK